MEKTGKKNALKVVAIILAAAIVVVGIVLVVFKFKDNSPEDVTEKTSSETNTVQETTEEETTEEPTTEFDTSVYDGVLDEYRSNKKGFEEKGYSGVENNHELCNDPSVYYADLRYAYADINGDSVKELIVATEEYEDEMYPTILNVWKTEDGEVKPLLKDKAYGYRRSLVICENNLFFEWIHCSGYSTYYNLYSIENDSSETVFNGAVFNDYVWENDEYSYVYYKYHTETNADTDSENRTVITKEEYDSILAEYVPVTEIEWINL